MKWKKNRATIHSKFFSSRIFLCASSHADEAICRSEVYLRLQHVPVCSMNVFQYFLFHLNIFNSDIKEDKWHRFTCAYGVNWFWFYFPSYSICPFAAYVVFSFRRVCESSLHWVKFTIYTENPIFLNVIWKCRHKNVVSSMERRTVMSLNGMKSIYAWHSD